MKVEENAPPQIAVTNLESVWVETTVCWDDIPEELRKSISLDDLI